MRLTAREKALGALVRREARRCYQLADDAEQRAWMVRKLWHSWRVFRLAAELAAATGATVPVRRLAREGALLHDLGRFAQILQTGHCTDSPACDHGRLGAELWLASANDCSRRRQAELSGIIDLHSRKDLPAALPAQLRQALNLVRDADRLDILRVHGHYFRAIRVELGVVGPAVAAQLLAGELVDSAEVVSVADAMVRSCSWLENFSSTAARHRAVTAGHLAGLAKLIPAAGYGQAVQAELAHRLARP